MSLRGWDWGVVVAYSFLHDHNSPHMSSSSAFNIEPINQPTTYVDIKTVYLAKQPAVSMECVRPITLTRIEAVDILRRKCQVNVGSLKTMSERIRHMVEVEDLKKLIASFPEGDPRINQIRERVRGQYHDRVIKWEYVLTLNLERASSDELDQLMKWSETKDGMDDVMFILGESYTKQ